MSDNDTLAVLNRTVEWCEPLLRRIWERHRHDDDIIVLADPSRDDIREQVAKWWDLNDKASLAKLEEDAKRNGALPFLPYLQPSKFLDALSQGGWAQREAAKELRAFAGMRTLGVVPLFVVSKEGHWATQWAVPGSGLVCVRLRPKPRPEAN